MYHEMSRKLKNICLWHPLVADGAGSMLTGLAKDCHDQQQEQPLGAVEGLILVSLLTPAAAACSASYSARGRTTSSSPRASE